MYWFIAYIILAFLFLVTATQMPFYPCCSSDENKHDENREEIKSMCKWKEVRGQVAAS